ncbi:MAG: hypothetical protein NC833_00335 [Candidatus Omnitrophica bacterium]|nr:hypothetical protein [Candidatus Omnitrophota bacterium]
MKPKLLFIFFLFFLCGCKTQNNQWKEKVKMGDYYFVNKNIDMALKYWIESLQIKKDPLTYEKIVSSFIIKNDFNEGERYALEGLTYFCNCDNLLFNLALIEFYLGKHDNSLRILDELLMKNMYYPNAHYLKGIIYEKNGEIEKAKKEFIEEININPGSKKAWKKIKEMKNEK